MRAALAVLPWNMRWQIDVAARSREIVVSLERQLNQLINLDRDVTFLHGNESTDLC